MKNTSGSKRFVGVIQARIGSTRLAEKMLLEIAGIPIFEWVLRRVKKSFLLTVSGWPPRPCAKTMCWKR